MNDFEERFGGFERLYSADGLRRLRQASVCVAGLGGVGSWAAEALARSGVGRITLVDLDDVCVSNVNRQLPALDGAIGRPKAEVMAERIQAINPACETRPVREFFNETTAADILSVRFDWVFDAIDQALWRRGAPEGARTRRRCGWGTWRKRRTIRCCNGCGRNCARSMVSRAIPRRHSGCPACFRRSRRCFPPVARRRRPAVATTAMELPALSPAHLDSWPPPT